MEIWPPLILIEILFFTAICKTMSGVVFQCLFALLPGSLEWKAIILSQEPARLFTNWQGVMVSREELWFTAVCVDTSCQYAKLYMATINHIDW